MEVVLGLKPQLPGTLMAGLPVAHVGVSDYAKALLEYLAVTHREVMELARESAVEHEGRDKGRVEGLSRGDLVLLRERGEGREPTGARKFDSRVSGEIYWVAAKMGENTYRLATLLGTRDSRLEKTNKFHADRLVKIDLPVMESSSVGREIEYTNNGDEWFRAKIINMAIDGRVYLQRQDNPVDRTWVDLSRLRYRWAS